MFKPQNLRASSQRLYEAFVRKTRSKPKDGDSVVKIVSGKPISVAHLLAIKGSCITPEKSSYPPETKFQAQTKAATDVVAKTSLPIFL
mmetsp:Transcript_26101/g.52428  ORF Transcript_26101/g.52428 Transcript_26101/m.52428 type:complete len:88 (-) Transcript_26101:363-626(-)